MHADDGDRVRVGGAGDLVSAAHNRAGTRVNPADIVETGPRSEVRDCSAPHEGHGTSRVWSRTLGGRDFHFTAVLMPDGERRYFAEVYNGYGDDGQGGDVTGRRFGCAWTPVGEWIVRP